MMATREALVFPLGNEVHSLEVFAQFMLVWVL